MRPRIDINADAGEAFGPWSLGDDASLFPQLTSVNLACGFHAGDPSTMARSVALATRHGVAIGAHPGFPDLVGFGRRDLAATPAQVLDDVLYQIGALAGFVKAAGGSLHHLKAHGALYQRMVADPAIANAVASAAAAFDEGLPVVVLAGPAGESMTAAVEAVGLRAVAEAFPDRGYLSDGSLAPRSLPGAVLDDPAAIAARAVAIARGEEVASLDGGSVRLVAETLCLHGDNVHAAQSAAAVRDALEAEGFTLTAF